MPVRAASPSASKYAFHTFSGSPEVRQTSHSPRMSTASSRMKWTEPTT